MADPLFNIRNNFYLGAYNTVINDAADLDHLSDAEAIERDCFVYRSYIALGSYDVSGKLLNDLGRLPRTAHGLPFPAYSAARDQRDSGVSCDWSSCSQATGAVPFGEEGEGKSRSRIWVHQRSTQ